MGLLRTSHEDTLVSARLAFVGVWQSGFTCKGQFSYLLGHEKFGARRHPLLFYHQVFEFWLERHGPITDGV